MCEMANESSTRVEKDETMQDMFTNHNATKQLKMLSLIYTIKNTWVKGGYRNKIKHFLEIEHHILKPMPRDQKEIIALNFTYEEIELFP